MISTLRILLAFVITSIAIPASAVVTIIDGPIITVTRGNNTPAVRVKITDSQGQPVPGHSVGLSGFYDSSYACCTDNDGILALWQMRASSAGATLVTVTTGGQYGSATFTMNVVPSGPLVQIAPVAGDGQRAVQKAAFSGIKFRATRAGAAVANQGLDCKWGSGPLIDLPLGLALTTDANGEAVTPGFTATAGYGAGTVTCSGMDNIEGTQVQGSAKFVVTYPDGNTWQPLAPLWWNPAKAGWGLSVPQHQDRLFPVLFTYRNGVPIWYVLDGQWLMGFGSDYLSRRVEYRGAPYYAFDTSKVVGTAGDSVHLTIKDVALTKANLDAPCAPGFSGGSGPICLDTNSDIVPFSFAPATPQTSRGLSDIWWGGPSQSGWGISIAEDHGNLFLAWFTYGADGSPTWFVMPEGQWTDANTWTGPVARTTGDGFLRGDTDGITRPYAATKVGDFSIRFSGTTAATFTYNVDGHAGTLNVQRFDY